MNNWKEISPLSLGENIIKLIGQDWMLIGAGNEEKMNFMTASWGAMGVCWGKNVCMVLIRPQRYTYEFAEKFDKISLSFFDQQYRDALTFCGKNSGRDVDKLQKTGLSACIDGDVPFINEARLVLECRKLYADDLREDSFIDKEMLAHYKNLDFHRFYICEIEKVLIKE